jgi:hypothetical protein
VCSTPRGVCCTRTTGRARYRNSVSCYKSSVSQILSSYRIVDKHRILSTHRNRVPAQTSVCYTQESCACTDERVLHTRIVCLHRRACATHKNCVPAQTGVRYTKRVAVHCTQTRVAVHCTQTRVAVHCTQERTLHTDSCGCPDWCALHTECALCG